MYLKIFFLCPCPSQKKNWRKKMCDYRNSHKICSSRASVFLVLILWKESWRLKLYFGLLSIKVILNECVWTQKKTFILHWNIENKICSIKNIFLKKIVLGLTVHFVMRKNRPTLWSICYGEDLQHIYVSLFSFFIAFSFLSWYICVISPIFMSFPLIPSVYPCQ